MTSCLATRRTSCHREPKVEAEHSTLTMWGNNRHVLSSIRRIFPTAYASVGRHMAMLGDLTIVRSAPGHVGTSRTTDAPKLLHLQMSNVYIHTCRTKTASSGAIRSSTVDFLLQLHRVTKSRSRPAKLRAEASRHPSPVPSATGQDRDFFLKGHRNLAVLCWVGLRPKEKNAIRSRRVFESTIWLYSHRTENLHRLPKTHPESRPP